MLIMTNMTQQKGKIGVDQIFIVSNILIDLLNLKT